MKYINCLMIAFAMATSASAFAEKKIENPCRCKDCRCTDDANSNCKCILGMSCTCNDKDSCCK